MYEIKQNVAVQVPVVMTEPNGDPVTGIASANISVGVVKADGTNVVVTPSAWSEKTTGPHAGTGFYMMTLPASALDQVGVLSYAVSALGAKTYIGVVKVVDYLPGDLATSSSAPTAVQNAAAVWDRLLSSHTTAGTAGQVVAAINTKTANLPSDPASQAAIKGANNVDLSQLAGTGFASATHGLVALRTAIPGLVWDEVLTSHSVANSSSSFVKNISSSGVIADAVWDEVISTGHSTSNSAAVFVTGINSKTTNLPSDPASNSQITSARQAIMGSYNFGVGLSITDIAGGNGFIPSTDNLHNIQSTLTSGGIDPSPIANAVWNKALSSFASGTAGNNLYSTYGKAAALPADPASSTNITAAVDSIKGADSLSITDIAGDGFDSATNSLAEISLGVSENMTDITEHLVHLRRIGEGHWKIFTSGPDANRLVLYSADGSTVLQKWDLKDQTGAPSTVNVFERVPTEPIP